MCIKINKVDKQEVGISRNLMGSKTLPTIWYTYMMLVTKYQILPSTVTEKNATKNILDGRKDRRTDVKQYTPPTPPGSEGIIKALAGA